MANEEEFGESSDDIKLQPCTPSLQLWMSAMCVGISLMDETSSRGIGKQVAFHFFHFRCITIFLLLSRHWAMHRESLHLAICMEWEVTIVT